MIQKLKNRLFAYLTPKNDGKIGTTNETQRREWLQKTLTNLPAGLKILDAGAGESQYKPFCKHLDYVSQDFSQYDGKGDGLGLQTKKFDTTKIDIVSDITAIPVPDASFDVVMCTEVFEHIPNPNKAFEELNRILKKGGYLIITAPFASITHFAPYHFATGFNRYFYQYLTKEEYDIIELTPEGSFYQVVAQELCRIATVAGKYSDYPTLTPKDKLGIQLTLELLNRLESKDTNSSELLCFGYYLLAKKK
jgi:ubiquinone/menaquinone biosynthesis C-methylase UbiE